MDNTTIKLIDKNKLTAKNLIEKNYKPEVDYHIHSIHSDGTFSISEIADMAIYSNLSQIIITDHNTILNGYKELMQIKPKLKNTNLNINIGSEVACKFQDIYTNKYILVEILCYNIDPCKLQNFIDNYNYFSEDSQEKDLKYLLNVCN